MAFVNSSARVEARSEHGSDSARFLATLNTFCVLEGAVAVAWQLGFARSAGIAFEASEALLLFLCVWLVYAADRWLDTRGKLESRFTTARHRFFARHRRPIAALWALVLVGSVALTASLASAATWLWGFGLLAATGIYFFAVHRRRAPALLREGCVALLFTGSVGFLVWSQSVPATLDTVLALGFAALVLCNLALIASAERDVDRRQGMVSLATCYAAAERHVPFACACLGLFAVAVSALAPAPQSLGFLGVSVAAAALLLLSRASARLGPELTHVLADAALLLPLPLWL